MLTTIDNHHNQPLHLLQSLTVDFTQIYMHLTPFNINWMHNGVDLNKYEKWPLHGLHTLSDF